MIKKKWDMFAESVSMSLSNIAGNKMRTFLTTLGIIIGGSGHAARLRGGHSD